MTPEDARVVCVFGDLLLGSNVLGMLRAAGYQAELHAKEADARRHAPGAAVLVVDLARGAVDGVALVEALRDEGALDATRTLGVYSHVDVETRDRAQAAGLDLVVPRSRMAREGPALVAGLLERPS